MRTITGNGYTITAPELMVYSTAGNYIRVATSQPIQPGPIVFSARKNNLAFCSIQRTGPDAIFPLDDIFVAALGTLNSAVLALSITIDDATINAGYVTINRAAQPYGAEFQPLDTPIFRVPAYFPIYPELPQTVELFAFSPSLAYVSNGLDFYESLTGWAKVTTTSSSVGLNSLIISDTPTGTAFAILNTNIDDCKVGYLVSWFDPDGLRHTYRFPKGNYTTTTTEEKTTYSFDALLRPVLNVHKKGVRNLTISTSLIGEAERKYVEGLLLSTEVTLLDLDEWAYGNTSPIPVTVSAGTIESSGKPYQRYSFQLNIEIPSL